MRKGSGHKRRTRGFIGQRNYYYETHNEDGEAVSAINEDEWKEQVKADLLATNPIEVSLIFHDKDVDVEGNKKGLHGHFLVKYEHPRSYERTMELLKVEPRNFTKLGTRDTGAYRYLTHTTEKAMNDLKYRYPIEELIVFLVEDKENNTYHQLEGDELWLFYRDKIAGTVKQEDNKRTELEDALAEILYDLSNGEFLENWDIKEELIEQFGKTDGVLAFTKYRKHFDNARIEYSEKKFREWKENGRKFQAIYIDGPSGLGKTTLANKLARRINRESGRLESLIHDAPNTTPGTRFDFVQDYQNELVTVFDDLDPRAFSYEEFLNLFESDKVARANSRFENKPWFAEYAIITKSMPLAEWTKELSSKPLKACKDPRSEEYSNVLWQPRRRFHLEIELDFEKASFWQYQKVQGKTNSHRRKLLDRVPFKGRVLVQSEELQNEIIDKTIELLKKKRSI